MGRRPSSKALESMLKMDQQRLLKLARIKYQGRDVQVDLHPDHPISQLKSADDAVYTIKTRRINTLDWYLTEQGVLPALLRGLK